MVGKPRICSDIHMEPVGGQPHPIQAATVTTNLLKASRRTYPKSTVIFRSQCITRNECGTGWADLILPAEFRIDVCGTGQHEHTRQRQTSTVRAARRRIP